MCRVGDIIVVEHCIKDGKDVGRHSYVVLNTDKGEIEGLSFDLVCNLMSSLEGKSEEYKKRKLSYPENMPYSPTEEHVINGHGKEGFIKAGVYFLFDRSKLNYRVIGNIEVELYIKLMSFIKNMNKEDIQMVFDNLTSE